MSENEMIGRSESEQTWGPVVFSGSPTKLAFFCCGRMGRNEDLPI